VKQELEERINKELKNIRINNQEHSTLLCCIVFST
jgi:hypothetical protein